MKQSNIVKRVIIAAGVLASVAFYVFESGGADLGNRQDTGGLILENGDPYGSGDQEPPGIKASDLDGEELKNLIKLAVDEAVREALEDKMQEAAEGALGDTLREAVRDEIIKAGEEGYLDDALSRSSELAEKKSSLVNINTADKNELMTLEGVGEKRASDIISYREQNGGFNSIDELMNVSGIKEAMYEKIREKITV